MKRVILIVLDSVGCGYAPDAADYGDVGANTLLTCSKNPNFNMPNMRKLGYLNLDGVKILEPEADPLGATARLQELSKGKDTTTGHWEMAGVVSKTPMPTYPDGFPEDVIARFEEATGRKVLCNKPYSGTEVIKDYGEEHLKTGALIVYTSADSVFQIAAHEDIVPVEQLYEYCQIARNQLQGEHGVGRVIARPFTGTPGNFTRTSRRHDFSLEPTGRTMCDILANEGYAVNGVGKIVDIFAGRGITDFVRLTGNPDTNPDGIEKTIEWMEKDFDGLLFVNLVDTDMLYGHRNDVDGYSKSLSYFDAQLPRILERMGDEDILMVTADHGCDPGFIQSTDHSREYVPLLMYGKPVTPGKNYGTLQGFDVISDTILAYFNTKERLGDKALEL